MVLSLKTWKSRSLPGLPRTDYLITIEIAEAAAVIPRRLFAFLVWATCAPRARGVRFRLETFR
jgi:hypothetical protein